MPRPVAEFDGGHISLLLSSRTIKRLEHLAPTVRGARSAFIRRAIEHELDRLERQVSQDLHASSEHGA